MLLFQELCLLAEFLLKARVQENIMTLQQLKYAVKVAEKGSINEAAKELYISQPSLSSAIMELEKEIKQRFLFVITGAFRLPAKALSFSVMPVKF